MNKTVKSFSVQVKQYSLVLILIFLLVETIIEIMRKLIFTEKSHCSQQKLFLWLMDTALAIYQIFQEMKIVSPSNRNVFLTNSSFRQEETNFLSSTNSIVLFRALLKILKFGSSSLFKKNLISACRNCVFAQWKLSFHFLVHLLVKSIFCLAETYF